MFKIQMIGTDAEVFLKNKNTQEYFPVTDLLGGDKLNPRQLEGHAEGFCVQEDNVAAEFNIPPASDAQVFSDSIEKVLQYLVGYMERYNLEIDISSSAHFNPELLQNPKLMRFGCEPDMNAWTLELKTINLSNPLIETFRTCAAHIHVSYEEDGEEPKTLRSRATIAKMMDLFIGVPLLFVDPDRERRQLYGQAGSFRKKNYGLEYRAVGNVWIKTPELRKWVFDQTHKAFNFLNTEQGMKFITTKSHMNSAIVEAIDGYDLEKASLLCNHFNLSIPV